MLDELLVSRSVTAWRKSPFASADGYPWHIVESAENLISKAFSELGADYLVADNVAVHESAIIEQGAILKGPAIIGPRCFVAGTAYLRGGAYLAEDCIIGPGCELKTSFMFQGSKIAHLNFVGDSILGADVNIEAGAIIANYRNELADKMIRIIVNGEVLQTGSEKFGALVGDGARIGANAVIAPGALIASGSKVGRMQLVDQSPDYAAQSSH